MQALLRRLLQIGDPSRDPPLLSLEAPAAQAFNAFLERLHGEVRQAEGLEAAWLGKGRGAVACLAATFALMEWSATSTDDRPRSIGLEAVERAVSLWSDYYRPHASAFLQSSAPTDVEGQVRRVVRWMRSDGRAIVSRRDVRRTALAQTVNANEADRVMARLVESGVLRPLANEGPAQRGRPALRWQVNPLLASNERRGSAENAGNAEIHKTLENGHRMPAGCFLP